MATPGPVTAILCVLTIGLGSLWPKFQALSISAGTRPNNSAKTVVAPRAEQSLHSGSSDALFPDNAPQAEHPRPSRADGAAAAVGLAATAPAADAAEDGHALLAEAEASPAEVSTDAAAAAAAVEPQDTVAFEQKDSRANIWRTFVRRSKSRMKRLAHAEHYGTGALKAGEGASSALAAVEAAAPLPTSVESADGKLHAWQEVACALTTFSASFKLFEGSQAALLLHRLAEFVVSEIQLQTVLDLLPAEAVWPGVLCLTVVLFWALWRCLRPQWRQALPSDRQKTLASKPRQVHACSLKIGQQQDSHSIKVGQVDGSLQLISAAPSPGRQRNKTAVVMATGRASPSGGVPFLDEADASAAAHAAQEESCAAEEAAMQVEAAAAAAAAEEELRAAEDLAREAEEERAAAEALIAELTSVQSPKQGPVRRDTQDLAAELRRRRAVCAEFQSAPVDARADAVAEEKKEFDFLKASPQEEEEEDDLGPASGRKPLGKKSRTQEELKEWMSNRRNLCAEVEYERAS